MDSRKRMHFSESSNTASSESDDDYERYQTVSRTGRTAQRKTREPKSLSRNALMARENRLRKKLYMQNLETQLNKERTKNRKINTMLKEQANVIEKQEKEIKYMRSILANNADISKLLRSIHNNTGLCVGTSLNKNLTIKNTDINLDDNIHPWSDNLLGDLPMIEDECSMSAALSPSLSLDDHNYTVSMSDSLDESLGVCLHISNHKVSLEYCSTCHDNSNKLWNEEDTTTV